MHHVQVAGQAIFACGLIEISGALAQCAAMNDRDETRSLTPEVRAMRLEAQKKLLEHIPAWAEKKRHKTETYCEHLKSVGKCGFSLLLRGYHHAGWGT